MSIDDKGDLASLKGPVADGGGDKSISRGSISPKTSREGTPSPTSPEDLKGIVPLEHIRCDGDYYSFPKPISCSPIPNLGTFKTTMQKKNGLVGSLALIGKLLDLDKVEAYVLCLKKEGWVALFLERLMTEDQDTQAEVLQKAFSCTEISNDTLLKLVKQCSLTEAEKLELSKERALKGDSMLLQMWGSKDQRLQWYEELIDKHEMNDRLLCVDNLSRNEIFSLYVEKERWEEASRLIVGRSFHEWCSAGVRIDFYRHLIDSDQIQKLLSYVNNSTRSEIFAILTEKGCWEEASKLSQQGDFHSWSGKEQRNDWYQKLIDSGNLALLKVNVNDRTRSEIFSMLIENGKLDEASVLIDLTNKFHRWCPEDQRIRWYQKLIDSGNIALLKAYVRNHTKLEIFSILVKNGKLEEVSKVISDKSKFHKWCPEDQRKELYQKLIQAGRKEDVFLWMNEDTRKEVFSVFVTGNQWDIAFSLFSGLPQVKSDYTQLNKVNTLNEDSLYFKSVSDLCSHYIESGDEGKVAYLWRNLDSGLKRQLSSKVQDKFGVQFLRNL